MVHVGQQTQDSHVVLRDHYGRGYTVGNGREWSELCVRHTAAWRSCGEGPPRVQLLCVLWSHAEKEAKERPVWICR